MKDEIIIRKIMAGDNPKIAAIIRSSLEDFNAVKQGTVYFDETTDHLCELFKKERSCYFIATLNNEVVAGAGIFPTEGLPPTTCELVKMYVSSAARGKGLGKTLLLQCLHEAKNQGFKKMYIETMPELTNAIEMYKKYGFTFIPSSLGNSGHSGCDLFMIRDI
ncbi:GNAT family N-acetyltransferase [Ginsengibacter hankyongi]|nr:GNAT family N-acetyltransferase [Ginsengibacter hankyongi]